MSKAYIVCIPTDHVQRMASNLMVGDKRRWLVDGLMALEDNPSELRIQGPSAPCTVITLQVNSLEKHPDGDAVMADCTVTHIGVINVTK